MRGRGERGETLAETLVSVTLLGIIGIGIIGAIASVLISTDIDRRVSASETVLRSYVAAIEDAPYEACAAAGSYRAPDLGLTLPAHYDAEVTSVWYWNAPDPTVRPAPVAGDPVSLDFVGSCPGSDPGLQKIEVTVRTNGARTTTEKVTFFKRRVGP